MNPANRSLANRLDRFVTILRAARADDGMATVNGPFTPIATRAAAKTDVSDGEQIAAAAQGASVTARFLMRWEPLTAGIASTDRILCEGTTYEVVGCKEALGRRIAVEITAKAMTA